MLKSIKKFLSKFDIYGGKFEMNLGKDNSYKTVFGSFLSLLFITLVTLSVYIFVSKYTDTTKPQITVSSEISSQYPQMNLYDEWLVVGFVFFNGKGFVKAEDVHRYATFMGIVSIMTMDESAQTPKIEKIPVEYIPCKEASRESGMVEKAFSSTNSSHLFLEVTLCPSHDSLERWILEGNIASPPFTTVNLMAYPCSLPDQTQCASLQELAVSSVYVAQLSKSVDYADKNNPVRSDVDTNTELLINPMILSKQLIYYKRNQILDDDKDFSEPVKGHEFINVDNIISSSGIRDGGIYCSPEKLKTGLCQPYIYLQLKSGNKISTVHRRYEKLFVTISELGGFGDLIYIIFSFLYLFYNHYFYKRWMKKQMMACEQKKLEKYMRNFDRKELDKKLERLMEENTNALVMIERMSKLKVLFELFFKPCHHKLLPLLMIEMDQSKEEAENDLKSFNLPGDNDKIDTIFDNGMSLKQAYAALRNIQPNNEIQEKINQLFVKKLAKHFGAGGISLAKKANRCRKNAQSMRNLKIHFSNRKGSEELNKKRKSEYLDKKNEDLGNKKRSILSNKRRRKVSRSKVRSIHGKLEFQD